MSVITDIADAAAAEINAGSFSQPVTATREYLPVFELAEMQQLRVTVVPKSVTTLPGGRAHNQHDYGIDVAVQKKLDAADNSEIDDLMTLVEEIGELFRFKRLDSYPNAMWLKTENQPVYAQEHLQELPRYSRNASDIFGPVVVSEEVHQMFDVCGSHLATELPLEQHQGKELKETGSGSDTAAVAWG